MSVAIAMLPFQRRLSRDPSLPKPKACRNLFGRPDKHEVDQLLKTELRKYEEEDRKKYNFDFTRENPFEGRYVWETCDPQDVPACYRSVTVAHKKSPAPQTSHDFAESEPVSTVVPSASGPSNVSLSTELQARLQELPSSSSSSEQSQTATASSSSTATPKTSAITTNSKSGKKSTSTSHQRRRRSASPTSSTNQTHITDFLQQRKRHVVDADQTSKRRKLDDSTSRSTYSPSSSEKLRF